MQMRAAFMRLPAESHLLSIGETVDPFTTLTATLPDNGVLASLGQDLQELQETQDQQDLQDPKLETLIGSQVEQLREEVALIEGVYPAFDRDAYLAGDITPVFFGSALNNFGVRELLDCFIQIAPIPKKRLTDLEEVDPYSPSFSGFIFKIHANLDPKHRDRIAFLRICSGTFERNKRFLHVRTGKTIKFATPTAFMAQDKHVIDTAYPGDIIGLLLERKSER